MDDSSTDINDRAPISSLPNEILAAIFEMAHHPLSRGDRFEITISHVTQHWRNVAISMPMLRTSIWGKPMELELITAYFQRSLVLPFAFTLVMVGKGRYNSDEHEEQLVPFFHLLEPHMGRCRQLFIKSSLYIPLAALFKMLRDIYVPILETLFVSFDSYNPDGSPQIEESDTDIPAEIFVGGAPYLTNMGLANVGLHCCLPPLHSLANLYILVDNSSTFLMTSRMWHHAVSSASSLLHLQIDGELITDWTSTPVVQLPLLQTLSIEMEYYCEHGLIYDMIRTINAPSLQVLSLGAFCDPNLQNLPSPSSGTQPQFPSLRALFLCENMASSTGLLQIVQSFLHISHLTYYGSAINSSVNTIAHHHPLLSLLQEEDPRASTQPKYWPELRSIALCDAANTLRNAEISQLLSSRSSMGAPIQHLLLREGFAEKTSALQSEGIFDGVRFEEYTDNVVRRYIPYWNDYEE